MDLGMKTLNSADFLTTERVVVGSAGIQDADIACYVDEIPLFVESALENVYANIYASIAQWRISGAIKDASTFVLHKNGKPATVLLFRREGNRVTVINHVITINHEDVERFAQYIFANFSAVTVISFHAIQTDVQRLPFPYQRVNHLEDIVVPLPISERDYLASLGHATRKNLNRHRNRLKRDFPSFSYEVYERGEIDEQHVCAIVKFNWARMAGKNKTSGHDERATQRLISLARTHGFIWVASIDGRICAGAVCLCIGPHYFMEISSHDSAYDDYRIGTLCCYLAICACIARGGSELHLLWGRYEYKYMLMGVQRDLDNLVVYRDRLHLLRNGTIALRTAIHGYIRQVKLWLHDPKNQDSSIQRFAITAVNFLRGVRQLLGFT